MKIYRIVVIVLSVIIGIAATVLMILNSPIIMTSYNGSITSENYQILKDYAFEIANNFDTELNEDIVATKDWTKESLIVNVDASLYGVEAIFPLSNYEEKIENGIIKFEGVIDYNNVTYSEYTDVEPPLYYTIITIYMGGLVAFLGYALFYIAPYPVIKYIKKLTKKH